MNFLCICWAIWKNRNSWLLVGCGEMPDQVKSSVELPFNNLLPNQAQQVEVQSRPGVGWLPPSFGVV